MSVRASKRRSITRIVDVRLVVGVALVAASIAGVWAVVASADRSVSVYAAGTTIVAGNVVGTEDLVVEQVSLGRSADLYVAPGGLVDGAVATRSILAGELVPAEAIAATADLAMAPVVVSVSGELPEGVVAGRDVDVWASGSGGQGDEADPPSVLVAGALVARIVAEESIVAGSSEVSVELSVPDGAVAVLLAASTAGDALTLVPVEGGAR
ncbi:SAF domain-containing protein [Labedella populi]|nr:SAF domain-containing protein [Labedella populi]